MLAHGDEFARTQGGNNNVYCQDNEIAWMNWDRLEEAERLHSFTKRLITLRREHPIFRRRRFLTGGALGTDAGDREIAWLVPDGSLMTQEDWDSAFGKALTVYLNGDGITETDRRGRRVTDDSFILMFNAHFEDIEFTVPPAEFGARWEVLVDTTEAVGYPSEPVSLAAGDSTVVPARATLVLKQSE